MSPTKPVLPRPFLEALKQRCDDARTDFSLLGEPVATACQESLRLALRTALAGDSAQPDVYADVVRFAVLGQQFDLLAEHGLPYLTYRYLEPYEANLAEGPVGQLTERRGTSPTTVLGYRVATPIGLGSSVLTGSADFVRYFVGRGYSVIVLKTVRTRAATSYPKPNWSFVPESELPPNRDIVPLRVVTSLTDLPKSLLHPSTVNSFGLPSPEPKAWKTMVRELIDTLPEDVLVVVSVVGSYDVYTGDDFERDFADAAREAHSAGARAIELNLSCPNVDVDHGSATLLCENVDSVERIVRRVRDAVGDDTKLIIKLGLMDIDCLRDLVNRCGGLVDAIAGINTVRAEVLDHSMSPLFPDAERKDDRKFAGLSGAAIRNAALGFVADLRRLREEYSAQYEIFGMGGVLSVQDYQLFKAAGADYVQTVTGAFANPTLAEEIIAAEAPYSDVG